MRRFYEWNTTFVSIAAPQVNVERPNERGPVTAITIWGICSKIGLAFGENRPKLTIPPRPGPGSSGQAVSGSPSTPGAVGPPLSFWGKIRFPDLRLVPYFSLFFVGVRGRLHASPPFSQSAPKSWDQARWWGVFYPRSPSARDRGHRRGWTHSLGGLKPSFILVVEWRG